MPPEFPRQLVAEKSRKAHDYDRPEYMLGFDLHTVFSIYFFPPLGRCARSLAAALLSALLDFGSRRTFEAAEPAFLPVGIDITSFPMNYPWRLPQVALSLPSHYWHAPVGRRTAGQPSDAWRRTNRYTDLLCLAPPAA